MGAEVNRFSVMARYAVQGISYSKETSHNLVSKIKSLKEKVSFEMYLKSYEIFYFLSKVTVKFLLKIGIITVPNVETISIG